MFDAIDINRLSRDYSKEPIKRGERPTKEDLEYLYLELNLDMVTVTKFLGCGKSTRNIQKFLREYSIKKDPKKVAEINKRNNLEKYGVTSVFGRKDVQEKIKQSNIERYGVENPSLSKELVEKRKETYINRYGVDNPSKLDEVKEKKKETCLKHFGVDNYTKTQEYTDKTILTNNTKYGSNYYTQTSEFKDKVKETCLNKYGVSNVAKDNKIKEKIKKTNLERYGVTSYLQSGISKETLEILNSKDKLEFYINNSSIKSFVGLANSLGISDITLAGYIRKWDLSHLINSNMSRSELEIRDIFQDIKFVKDRTVLDGKEIDLYSPKHKIGIEFNGNYWHSDLFRDKDYHYNKSMLAQKKGLFIFHIFEYEWNDERTKDAIIYRLKNLFLKNHSNIYARNCIIKEVSFEESVAFLNENHVQGKATSGIRLGLYYKDELVSLMEFITNPINKNYQYELNRFCSKSGCNVVGGASKLFKYFINAYKPTSIISYSDIAKTTGKIYETLGFKLSHISEPQYHWTNGNITYNRYQCQLKELRKVGWLLDGENRTESEVMRSHGFSKIYDCGKKVWVIEFK